MFNLKILNHLSHPDLASINATIAAHPKRKFTIELSNYNFPGTKVKELLNSNCNIWLKKDDGYSENQIKEFIILGKQLVILHPKSFLENEVLNYLEKGASTFVSRVDGYDVFQITKMVNKGKERTTVIGGKDHFRELDMQDYLKAGSCIYFKKGDLSDYAITRLLPDGELPDGKSLICIQAAKFTNIRVNIFLEGKANIIFGEGNEFSQNRIKQKVTQFNSQTYIESEHFNFDLPWIKEMEELGANII